MCESPGIGPIRFSLGSKVAVALRATDPRTECAGYPITPPPSHEIMFYPRRGSSGNTPSPNADARIFGDLLWPSAIRTTSCPDHPSCFATPLRRCAITARYFFAPIASANFCKDCENACALN
jgi:hypothetical protein